VGGKESLCTPPFHRAGNHTRVIIHRGRRPRSGFFFAERDQVDFGGSYLIGNRAYPVPCHSQSCLRAKPTKERVCEEGKKVILLQCLLLFLVAATGTVVVFTRYVRAQIILLSFYGLLLSILFLLFQAPDVAYSEIVVGSAALPLMLLAALSKIERKSK
jgi:uncharacterized MnhB-related membrane protein